MTTKTAEVGHRVLTNIWFYLQGALFLFFAGRIEEIKGNLTEVSPAHRKTHNVKLLICAAYCARQKI